MATVTLLSLRDRVRQRADMPYSKFVSDSELNSYINASAQELYDLLVAANEQYYSTSENFSLTAGVNTHALPATFYKLLGVDQSISGAFFPLKPYGNAERGYYQTPAMWRSVAEVVYQLVGNSLEFLPAESAVGDYRVRFVPFMTVMAADGDTFNGYNGYEEYIVIDASIKCKDKEESDTKVLERAKAAMKERIAAMTVVRDQGQSATVQDVRANSYG